jgi:hypothetical protein
MHHDHKQTSQTTDAGETREMGTAERLLRSFGPLAVGLLLDAADSMTWGPVGMYLGPVVGGILGW